MAITVPKDGDAISATTFGAPVANQLNLIASKSPLGQVAFARVTAQQTVSATGQVTITGSDLVFTVPAANRIYTISAVIEVQIGATALAVYAAVKDVTTTTDLQNILFSPAGTNSYNYLPILIANYRPTVTGSHTIRFTMGPNVTGPIYINPYGGSQFLCTDIGGY